MEEFNNILEQQLAELDYLYQEGVVFSQKELIKFNSLVNKLAELKNHILLDSI